MKQKNPQLLQEVRSIYQRMVGVMLDFDNVEDLEKTLHTDFIGYGTAKHEFLETVEDVKKMAQIQKDQLEGQEFRYERKLISEKIFANGTCCLILEEFNLFFPGMDHHLLLRLSSLLERIDGAWLVTHVHGSTPDSDIAEEEAFPEQGLRRKNEELEAKIRERTRELEIEAALERTRAQSLQMQHSSELNEVSKVFHEQLLGLGVDSEFSFVWLPDEAHKTHLFWTTWASESMAGRDFHSRAVRYPLDKSEPYTAACFADWESGVSVHEHFVPPAEIKAFFASWEELLEGAEGLKAEYFPEGIYYTEAFMKYGCFGIDIRRSVTEEEKSILHRFAIEFERTYTRFLDLKKAEAQAREGEIEIALERVRSRSMAMQASEELSDLVITVFRELSSLDMVLTRCLIWIFDPQDDSGMAWMANSEDPDVADSYYVPYHDHPAYQEFLHGWKSVDPKWEYSLEGEVKESWDEILVYGYFESLPENIKAAMKAPERVMLSGSFNNFGLIQTASLEPLSEENLDILYRFSHVFEQSYTRFLDLQRAEARVREAEIETALERIRSQVTGMQESTELLDIVVTMRSEFVRLGHEAHYFWHMRWLPDKYQKAMTSGDGTRIGMVMELPRHMHGDIPLLAAWEKGDQPTVVYAMDAEAAVDYVDKMVSLGNFQQIDPQAPSADDIRHIGGLTFVMARTTHGEIGFSLPGVVKEPPAEALETLVRFAGVFDLAYRRFEDLKESERQKREAEIELALERVRARTMAMQNSSELKSVIRVIFDQLAGLEINAEHAGIVVDYSPGQDWSFWVAETQDIPSKITIPYLDSLWDRQYSEAKAKGTDFFTTELSFEEKNNFYEALLKHIPGLTKETREFYLTCPGLAISTVVEEDIGLYIENFSGAPYSEEENSVLKRFGSVFQQTYTRFLDLKKAEAQAREAQIEASLERVRAQTMAMHQSHDLEKSAQIVFEELEKLDLSIERSGIGIFDRKTRSCQLWTTAASGEGKRELVTGSTSLTIHPMLVATFDAWESQTPVSYVLEGEELKEYYQIVSKSEFILSDEVLEKSASLPREYYHYTPFGAGGLYFFSDSEPLPADIKIMRRFAEVFDMTYTRYEDLKKAEKQAREAQIEAALEKVRTRTMAMQKGEELKEVAVLLYKELIGLGVNNFVTCGYVEIKEELGRQFTWVTAPGGDTLGLFYLPLTGDATFDERYAAWKRQQRIFHQTVAGKVRDDHLEYAITTFNSKEAEEMVRSQFPDPTVFYCFNFSHGYLHLVTGSKLKEEEEILLARFTRVFEQTYARFLDLKKAEAQAREAQIENALEKVRSRTMAMQHSDELPEAANVLFLEIQALGIPAWSCGYNILAKDKKSATCIMSSEGTLQSPFKLRLEGERSFDQWGEFVGSDEKFMIQELGEKVLVEHYEFMKSFPDLQPIFEEIERLGLELPTYQINHLCKFTHGFLLFITYEEVPDAHDIFKRFTAVFEQTYTRFLDLKNMEAQARESKIETALERVRARALAMQEPEELKEVARVMRQEMGLLGVEELETSSIYIHDAEAGKTECWYAIKDIREAEKVMVADHFDLDLKDTWVGREMLKFYESESKQVSIVMKGAQRKQWIDYCEAHSNALKGYYGEQIPERTYHLYKFSNGAIGAATPGDLSGESWSLLKRAASVFSLAYSRFRDLTQARIDLQRLKEEKKRAEDALKELQLTQQQLVHAEKMASLGELTAGIAHEIQNPLNFVNNFSEVSRELLEELLEEMKKGDAEEVEAITHDVIQNLEKIVHHGKRADGIVKGMLQHSRSGDGKKEPTDLNALADEYLRLAYHGLRAKDKSFNAAMETDFDPGLPKVDVIPQDIGRVLLNLITNAFHAVNERRASAPDGYHPTVWVQTQKTETGVELSVRDNGGGIPEAIRDKIFQPFFTTKPTGEGTGLGLSMSYDIVTKGHGGALTMDTREGKGTTFVVNLNAKTKV